MNPIFFKDFYKVGHPDQYPVDTTQIWTNWTPRSTRVADKHYVVNAGVTYLAMKYFIESFNWGFFAKPEEHVVQEYHDMLQQALNVQNPNTDRIRSLHRLGYLPLKIYALPEGYSVPLNIPPVIMTNTKPEFFWLPNTFETLTSSILWPISTSATTAQRFWKVFMKWAVASGEKDFSFVPWQGHDFSMRGMMGPEAAALSGLGHLMVFNGTDTIPALIEATNYYKGSWRSGGSVNATEHSVMSAGGDTPTDEFATFKRLLTEVYPTGILSVVSDTWDLWRVLTDYVPRLKDVVLKRDGKLVIRPDSGDPVKIMTGNPSFVGVEHGYPVQEHPAVQGAVRLLANALGVEDERAGLPLINKGAVIYGDGISLERADQILSGTVQKHRLSPYNVILGIGSYTYQFVTRDTYGFAMKATARRDTTGKIHALFKRPVTDDGTKFSHKGLLAVYETEFSQKDRPDYFLVQNATEAQLNECAYEVVFEDSKLKIHPDLETIRQRVRIV